MPPVSVKTSRKQTLLSEELRVLRKEFPRDDFRGTYEKLVKIEQGNRIIGIGGVFKRHGIFNSVFILVPKAYRGKGYGKMLMEHILNGSRYMLLTTLPSNKKAISLYKKFKFRTICLWRNQGKWFIVMLRVTLR